jgi:outer membrane lipoprotein SlyB
MEAQAVKSTHPILIIAGIAVTVFSLAGVAAIMGWIPSSKGQNANTPAPIAQLEAPQAPVEAPRAAPEPAKEVHAPAAHVAKPKPRTHVAKQEPVRIAKAEPQPQVAQIPPPPPARIICRECGVIDGIHEVEKAGEGSGGGAIGGAIVGGVAGHQMGSGRGNTVMTVLGALGGAVAGNAVEKKVKTTKEYEVLVKFEDGNTRIITMPAAPAWRVGDKVKVVNGVIESNG